VYPRKVLVVELAGGLGNQLFQYFAGLLISQKLGRRLVLDVRFAQYSHSEFDITSFDLSGKFLRDSSARVNWVRKRKRYIIDGLRNKSSFFNFMHAKILKQYRFRGTETIAEVFAFSQNSRRITGYFANKYFITEIQRTMKLLDLQLKNPSDWFQRLSAKALIQRPVMVHIRRGDFKADSDHYGLLSELYYAHILNNISAEFTSRGIWIFSDEPELVSDWELWRAFSVNFVNQIDSTKADPAEFLKLMSLGGALLVGNSSFSYFAGVFTSMNSNVYCPDPPMKGAISDSDVIYPSNWIRVQAQWL
jgi:hypothetical protein